MWSGIIFSPPLKNFHDHTTQTKGSVLTGPVPSLDFSNFKLEKCSNWLRPLDGNAPHFLARTKHKTCHMAGYCVSVRALGVEPRTFRVRSDLELRKTFCDI